jgi:Tfp pilus assembly protein PilO
MRLGFKPLGLGATGSWRRRDPRSTLKIALISLAAANLIAAFFVFQPPGGSAEDLENELAMLRSQVQRQQANLANLRRLAAKVETARTEQEKFVVSHFLDRRTASSTILTEIGMAARTTGLKPKEHSFVFEPVEGSDIYSMMTISANYEGSYADLIEFVNFLDRSPRFLIIENITAAPQQQAGVLAARFKINAFVREEAGTAPAATADAPNIQATAEVR